MNLLDYLAPQADFTVMHHEELHRPGGGGGPGPLGPRFREDGGGVRGR